MGQIGRCMLHCRGDRINGINVIHGGERQQVTEERGKKGESGARVKLVKHSGGSRGVHQTMFRGRRKASKSGGEARYPHHRRD